MRHNPLQAAEHYASTQYEVNQYTEPDSVKGTGWTDCRDAWLAGFNADRWIPVTPETMPEYEVLAHNGWKIIIGYLEHENNEFCCHGDDCTLYDVTHWQPLPKTATL